MPRHVKAAEAASFYGTSLSNLRKWAREGVIPTDRTPKGRFLYVLPDEHPAAIGPNEWSGNIVYARVSSHKQKDDLNRQANFLAAKYPQFTIITDIGSGINYERKGFLTILERLFKGDVKRVVVAHQDRFTRFGFDFFQWLFQQFGAVLESVVQPNASSGEDMVADIMEVFTVFTARYYGRRAYHMRSKNKVISIKRAKKSV